MADVHVSFQMIGKRSAFGEAQVPIYNESFPRNGETVSTSASAAYTTSQAQGSGEWVKVLVPDGASVFMATDVGGAGSVTPSASDERIDGKTEKYIWLNGGDGLAFIDA